jgi:ATP-dependent Clp protease ATP-binding subunit ClpA
VCENEVDLIGCAEPMPEFSRKLEQALHRALSLANEREREYSTVEHLLLALVDDRDAAEVLVACKCDLSLLRHELLDYLENEPDNPKSDGDESRPTAGFQRSIQRAVIHVQASGREDVTGADVLLAILAEGESKAVELLAKQGVTHDDCVSISHRLSKIRSEDRASGWVNTLLSFLGLKAAQRTNQRR